MMHTIGIHSLGGIGSKLGRVGFSVMSLY